MKNHIIISILKGIILFIFFLSFSITYGQKTDQPTYPSQNPVMTLEERLSNNESLMTLDEKVAFLSSNPGVERMGIKRMRQVEDQHGLTQGTQYITTQKNKSKTIAPQKLKHTDIGNPAIAGKADITAKGFDITAGGADIWGKRDEFHFSYQTLKGDFDFIVSRAVTNMPDFVSWVRTKIKKQSKHELKNGILYLKGGDLTEELKDFPKATEYNISDFFEDEFFETKKVVHLPLKFVV